MGSSKSRLINKVEKKRRKVFSTHVQETRAALCELDERGPIHLLDRGEMVILSAAWSVRRAALKLYGRDAFRTLLMRHGKHSLFAGVAGTSLFFFTFCILRLLKLPVSWSSAWSFFTDFFVLLVLGAVPVLAIITVARAGFRANRRQRVAFAGFGLFAAMLLAVLAVDVSSTNGPIKRLNLLTLRLSEEVLNALPPSAFGVGLGLIMVVVALRMVWKVRSRRINLPRSASERFDVLGQACLMLSFGVLFASVHLMSRGVVEPRLLWYILIPGVASAFLFRSVSMFLEARARLVGWRKKKTDKGGVMFPHPLVVLAVSLGSYFVGALMQTLTSFTSPIAQSLALLVLLAQSILLYVGTPVLTIVARRCRKQRAGIAQSDLLRRMISQREHS